MASLEPKRAFPEKNAQREKVLARLAFKRNRCHYRLLAVVLELHHQSIHNVAPRVRNSLLFRAFQQRYTQNENKTTKKYKNHTLKLQQQNIFSKYRPSNFGIFKQRLVFFCVLLFWFDSCIIMNCVRLKALSCWRSFGLGGCSRENRVSWTISTLPI